MVHRLRCPRHRRTMEAETLPPDAILAGVVPRLTETGVEEFTVKRASDEAQAH